VTHRNTLPATQRMRRQSCEGKRRYSRREAQAAAVRATRRTGRRMRAYRCDFGEHWHLTSRPKP